MKVKKKNAYRMKCYNCNREMRYYPAPKTIRWLMGVDIPEATYWRCPKCGKTVFSR